MDSNPEPAKQDNPAWLRVYLARRARQPIPAKAANPVGRPRRTVPMNQTSMWLSAGDRELINHWQAYLGSLANHSLSLGETVAILARICQDRMAALGEQAQFEDLSDFILQMIGANDGEDKTPDHSQAARS